MYHNFSNSQEKQEYFGNQENNILYKNYKNDDAVCDKI